jgi:hypothetical protein
MIFLFFAIAACGGEGRNIYGTSSCFGPRLGPAYGSVMISTRSKNPLFGSAGDHPAMGRGWARYRQKMTIFAYICLYLPRFDHK